MELGELLNWEFLVLWFTPSPPLSPSLSHSLTFPSPPFLSILSPLIQANINQCGGSRLRTALHYATNYHQRGVVEVLLEHGADLGLQDADGNTPMNLCTDADILHLMSKEVSSSTSAPGVCVCGVCVCVVCVCVVCVCVCAHACTQTS